MSSTSPQVVLCPSSVQFLISFISQCAEQTLQTHGDHVLMGEIAYEFLARETNTPSGQCIPDYSGYTLLSEGTNHFMDPAFPTPGSAGYVTFPSTTYVSALAQSQKCSDISVQKQPSLPLVSLAVALSRPVRQPGAPPNISRTRKYSRTKLP
jgi:hypothetical protein